MSRTLCLLLCGLAALAAPSAADAPAGLAFVLEQRVPLPGRPSAFCAGLRWIPPRYRATSSWPRRPVPTWGLSGCTSHTTPRGLQLLPRTGLWIDRHGRPARGPVGSRVIRLILWRDAFGRLRLLRAEILDASGRVRLAFVPRPNQRVWSWPATPAVTDTWPPRPAEPGGTLRELAPGLYEVLLGPLG